MNIGENIYTLRTEKSMSQTDLANALDVSRQSVSKWENNSAVPDLERIIKMSELFDVTLDELVYGKKPEIKKEMPAEVIPQLTLHLKPRSVAGSLLLVFGMVFFLLSIFWGSHLWFGEEIGELAGLMISLIGLSMLATYDFTIFAISTSIFVIYSTFCYGFLHITSVASYVFTIAASLVFMTWFFAWGKHATEGHEFVPTYPESEE